MWISKIKKGFTLIEVLCTITIFSILFITCLTIQLNNSTLKKYNENIIKYSVIMEQIKNNMIGNFSYEDVKKLKMQNKYYISKENINLDNFKGNDLKNLFTEKKVEDKPYLLMTVEGDSVYKINLKLYTKILKKERVMECEFYKGKYER